MKKLKYMLSVLALALVLTCVAKAPMAVKADVVATTYYEPEKQYIEIEGASFQVYYQVIKTSGQDVKTTAWIPAAKYNAGEGAYNYLIDISTYTKETLIAYTTDATTTKSVAAKEVKLDFPVKSVKVTVDCKVDSPVNFYAAFSSIVVTGADSANNKSYGDTEANTLAAFLEKYELAWKRGANGEWTDATTTSDIDFENTYNMLRSSNGTLYVRVNKMASEAILPSKEVKVKIAKTAAAPAIKVDYVKGTVGIKSGMEFTWNYKDGAETKTATVYVPAQDKTSGADNEVGGFSATNAAIKDKYSEVSVSKLVAYLNTVKEGGVGNDKDLTINVRVSASDKKYASWYAKVTIKTPIAKPAVAEGKTFEVVINPIENTMVAELDGVFTSVDGRTLEYAIVPITGNYDFSSVKFTAVPESGKIDLSKSMKNVANFTYNKDKNKDVKISSCTIVVRWAAIKEDTKNSVEGKFASDITAAATVKTLPKSTLALTKCTVALKVGDATVKVAENKFSVAKDTTVTVTITPTVSTGKVVDKVTIKVDDGDATEIEAASGAYTTTITGAEAATTYTITVTEKDAPSSEE